MDFFFDQPTTTNLLIVNYTNEKVIMSTNSDSSRSYGNLV